MASSKQKVCVILGAGASYDVHGFGSAYLDSQKSETNVYSLPTGPEFRPPLVKDLFDLERNPRYREILNYYHGADFLAQTLAQQSRHEDFNLEEELLRLANHDDGQTRENFKQVPAYLRDLLLACSEGYTARPTSYSQLVQHLVAESQHQVLFLVLNYDDLLEKAITLYNPSYQFATLEHYVDPDRPVQVVKFHGSINWFTPMSGGGDWFERASRIDLNSLSSEIEVRDFKQLVVHYSHQTKRYYPVLTAPLAGKGLSQSVCPESHLTAATEFLKDCQKFLIVGTGGLDDDLMEFLDTSVSDVPGLFMDVVGPDATAVLARFRKKVSAFKRDNTNLHARNQDMGFQSYLSEAGIKSFAEHDTSRPNG